LCPRQLQRNPTPIVGCAILLESVFVEPKHQKKRPCSPLIPLEADYLKLAGEPVLHLGAAVLSACKLLYVLLHFPLVLSPFKGLVDLGSSNCFLDSSFVANNKLPFREIVPFSITLIDSTVNAHVTCIVLLPIKFSCGYKCTLEFFITKLKSTYPAVLSYSWLTHYNPIIN